MKIILNEETPPQPSGQNIVYNEDFFVTETIPSFEERSQPIEIEDESVKLSEPSLYQNTRIFIIFHL